MSASSTTRSTVSSLDTPSSTTTSGTSSSRGPVQSVSKTEYVAPKPITSNSAEEEILREICACNGLNYSKLSSGEGENAYIIEMFFSGYPKIVGLQNFPNLHTLTIVGQTITKINGLSALTKLQELWLCECQIKKIENVEVCKQLTKLFLYGNQISLIENVSQLSQLEVLWLNDNNITNIENMSTLIKLRELNLAENKIEKIGRSLDANIRLEDLNLSGNKVSSLKDLTNLARFPHLNSVSLKDPLYSASPVSQLCNYSTHVLYHLPNLLRLDTYDITAKHLSDLAETTVTKKKMYYNMRLKVIRRNLTALVSKLETHKRHLLEGPYQRMRKIVFAVKELEREVQELQQAGEDLNMCTSDTESEKDAKESKKVVDQSHHRKPIMDKYDALKRRLRKLERKCEEIEGYCEEAESRLHRMSDTLISRFMIELETGGNVRFEEGSPTDIWFSSCHDLVLSRFCAADYREQGIMGIKLHRIIRVRNRMLRARFDEKLANFTDEKDNEFYPLSKTPTHKKLLEYLFWMWDPDIAGGATEMARVLEEGFPDADMYQKLGRDGAVPLSNSLSLADRRRINCLMRQSKDKEAADSCPYRYGQLLVAKVYLGKSMSAMDDRSISKSAYHNIDAIFKPRRKVIPNEKKDGENSSCECSGRQCEWYIFDHELVLPEYIIEFEYITRSKCRSPFSGLSDELLENKPVKLANLGGGEDVHSEVDKEIFNMEPTIKQRPRLVTLNDELLLKISKCDALANITVLNLHGNGLTKLKHLQSLSALRKLIVPFNELTRLEDLAHMSLEYLDASFNKIITLEGMKGLSRLKQLDISWNRLTNTREELSILRKHMSGLKTLNMRYNPWLKPDGLRLRVIGRLKSLTLLDDQPVTEEEATAALRVAAGSRISQLSLLTQSRVDATTPRSLSLNTTAQIVLHMSRQKPEKFGEHDTSWYLKVSTLNLEGQHITKLSNLDRLENLKWASFSNNDLTKIEGLDSCVNLEELSLENNCIVKVEGLAKLTKLRRLSLGNNYINTLDNAAFSNLTHLCYVSLENNRLTSLLGLQRATWLVELYVGNNLISNIREVFCLKMLPSLVILDLFGNPVAVDVDHYRLFVIFHLKTLKALDGCAIEASEGNLAKDTFGGRLTADFVAEKLGHSNFHEVRELDLPNSSIRTVDLGTGEQFLNLRSVNLEHNNLTSFTGLVHLVNLRVLCLNHNHIECILPRSKATNTKQKFPTSSIPSKNLEFYTESFTPVLESLEVLHLGYNCIKDMGALQLSRIPALKALFLQGNEITKVEGLDGLHDLRELVLDRNKIKGVSELAFINQWNLVELHLEENRVRDLSNLSSLENLQRLYLGSNRIQDLSELEKLDSLSNLVEISIVNNVISRRLMHRPMLVFRMPQLVVIDGLPVTDEERAKAELYFADQQVYFQPTGTTTTTVEATLPGIGQYKTSVPVKVTNVQLSSPPIWSGAVYYDEATDSNVQRGGGRRRGVPKNDVGGNGLGRTGGNSMAYQHLSSQQNYGYNNSNRNGGQYSYLNNQAPYSAQSTADYVESLARMNNVRNNKR
ncbi:leucine-rich repeat-containing protein 9-like [Haliotis cracherodii]|uniref:leucine-rich repeat-containing protein 9-like n=1 Tax=Haliotis cracherodii TaxID=6455 RepID=UPI0039EC65F9